MPVAIRTTNQSGGNEKQKLIWDSFDIFVDEFSLFTLQYFQLVMVFTIKLSVVHAQGCLKCVHVVRFKLYQL